MSQNCLKLESENDRETIERTNALDFDDEDEKVLRKVDRILTRNNPFFKNLDLIFAKQNQVSIQMALLKHEQKQLTEENDDLTVIMREVFHNLATSSGNDEIARESSLSATSLSATSLSATSFSAILTIVQLKKFQIARIPCGFPSCT